MANVVVVEPWYGGSHKVWLDGWVAHSRHELELITMPDRFWRWRMRAGAVEAAARFDDLIGGGSRPDVVVVSSLVDASVFVGLARRSLGATPVAVYMHENQLLYPLAPNQRRDDDLSLANWRSLLAADAIWWNSDFHRQAFLDAVVGLLDRQPEPVNSRSVEALAGRSTTLWPGTPLLDLIEGVKPQNHVPVVLWNQRWDHDKNPNSVFRALAELADAGVAFELILAGENNRRDPGLDHVLSPVADRIRRTGFLPDGDYRNSLIEADVVVSAADHEFFGIAIVEAMAAGAVPVLPDRLSFPELVGPNWAGPALYGDGELRTKLADVFQDVEGARSELAGLRQSMARFDITNTAAMHDQAIDSLLGQAAPTEL